jgi:hypothetical protein
MPVHLRLNALAEKSKQDQIKRTETQRAEELKASAFTPDLSATANYSQIK